MHHITTETSATSRKRPNILLMFSDQQRADTLPCSGNTFVSAPYLDKMAQQGTVFNQCRTVFPVCTPARASMWTGVYPHKHGIIRNVYGVNDLLSAQGLMDQSLFAHLARNGYECAYYGKWHLGSKAPEPMEVFEAFNSLGGHWVDGKQNFQGGTWVPDRDTDSMIDWIRTRDKTRPFTSVISWYPPHDPFSAPLDCMDHYRRMGVPFPGYYASVTALDRCVGRIFAALDECGELDNTIIVYYSDHGETFHERDGTTNKFMCTEDSVRVPFLISGPGLPKGQTCDAFIGLQDLMPTVLDYAGIAVPPDLHGSSIRAILEDREADWRDSFYIENETYDVLVDSGAPLSPRVHERGVCTPSHKLIISQAANSLRIYDLLSDPEERVNLVREDGMADISELLATLMGQAEAHATLLDDPVGLDIIAANRAHWAITAP